MRGSILLAATLGATLAHGQAVNVRGSGGWGYDSTYNRQYNVNRQVTVTGTIAGKVSGSPIRGMEQAMSIVVRTAPRRTVTVDVGPRWFVAQQVAKLNVGERVKIIGSRGGRDGAVIARQIVTTKNGRVLALRDRAGYPYWVAYRSAPSAPTGAMDNANTIAGTITGLDTVTVDGMPMAAYVVNTPNGPVTVATAPQWFMNRQDYVIHPGAYVSVITNGPALDLGNGVIVANSLYTGGNTFVFRNGGVPIWNGWGG